MAVERAVAAIPSAHTIGALSLELGPLKGSLKAEAASWKAQFAKNLHAKGAEDLRVGAPASQLRGSQGGLVLGLLAAHNCSAVPALLGMVQSLFCSRSPLMKPSQYS